MDSFLLPAYAHVHTSHVTLYMHFHRGGNKVLWLCSHTVCPSTPDFVQSHTSYVSTYSSFCLVIYILFSRLELCLLGSTAFFTTLLCTVDARQMDYKLEQFQSPRMHSSVTTGNSNTVQGNRQASYRHWLQNCGPQTCHSHSSESCCVKQRNMSWLWWCAVWLQPAQCQPP